MATTERDGQTHAGQLYKYAVKPGNRLLIDREQPLRYEIPPLHVHPYGFHRFCTRRVSVLRAGSGALSIFGNTICLGGTSQRSITN